MAAKAVFQGDGTEFVAQRLEVPARDLDGEWWAVATAEQRAAVLLTKDSKGRHLYRVSGAPAERAGLGLIEAAVDASPVLAPASEITDLAPASTRRAKKTGEGE